MKKLLRKLIILIIFVCIFLLIQKNTTRLGTSTQTGDVQTGIVSTGIDLTNCVSYFDGCNNCSVKDGQADACTLMYCETPSEPKCLQYATGNTNIFQKNESLDSPYSGTAQYQGTIMVEKDLNGQEFMGNEEGLLYCETNKSERGSIKCPAVEHVFITLQNGYFDNELFYNKTFAKNYVGNNTVKKLSLGCLLNNKIVTTSFDEKYMSQDYVLTLLSSSDEQTIIQNINKPTLFTLKIIKNAYNIPGRGMGNCETSIEKVEIVK